MPPTQPPPQVPDFSQGPFQNFLQPPAQAEVEQAQQQGPQFSGYESKGVGIAGLLTKFIEGASVGRARSDARKLAQQTQKQSQDAQQINQFMQMSQMADIDPEVRQKLQMQAIQMQGKWAMQHVEEAGKQNPAMKGLHMILQTVMGGPSANETTQTDPKTGKKTKGKMAYEGGVDPEQMNALWSQLAGAPTRSASATQRSQGLMTEAKSAMDKWQETHPGQEMTREDAQGVFNIAGLTDRASLMEQTYGVNPIKNHLESLDPRLRGTQLLQDVQARGELQFLKEDERMAAGETGPTGPPPQSPFSLPTQGPAERADQQTAMEAGGKEKGWMPPSFLQRAVKYGRASQQNYIIDDDKEIPTITYRDGVVRDLSGNPIDSKRIGRPVYDKTGSMHGVAKTDKNGKTTNYWAFPVRGPGGDMQMKVAKDADTGEPMKMNTGTATGINRTVQQVYGSVNKLEGQVFALEQSKNRIENQVRADIVNFPTPAKQNAEIDRRKAELDDQINPIKQNLEANQKILQDLGGPDYLYDTTQAPPGTSGDLQDYFGGIK